MKRTYKRITIMLLMMALMTTFTFVPAQSEAKEMMKRGYEEGHYLGKQWVAHTEGSAVVCGTDFSYEGGGPVSCVLTVTFTEFIGFTYGTRTVEEQGFGRCKVHLHGGDHKNGIFTGLDTKYYVKDGCVGIANLWGWPPYSTIPVIK